MQIFFPEQIPSTMYGCGGGQRTFTHATFVLYSRPYDSFRDRNARADAASSMRRALSYVPTNVYRIFLCIPIPT